MSTESTSDTAIASKGNNEIKDRSRAALDKLQGVMREPSIRRAMPAIMVLCAVLLGVTVYTFIGQNQEKTLYSNLPEADRMRAIEVLNSGGIKATLDETTGEISIQASDFHRARVLLAAQGLPQGMPDGYSKIENMPMGTSRSIEAAKLRQMQELELARSIAEMEAIDTARVHLALPERTAFVRDTKPPRASVFVQVKQSITLDETQISAIVSLVSTSVPGLTRSNISVIDQNGRLLSSLPDDPMQILSDQQMKHRMRVETMYRHRIEALVTPLVGAGNAAVEVTVDMDFTRSEITSEKFAPDQSALRSEQQSEQRSAAAPARGVPGAVSNTPPAEVNIAEDAPGTSPQSSGNLRNESLSKTRNYEVSRRVETTVPAAARIVKISAAVVLREPEMPELEEVGDNPPTPGFPEDFLKDIESLAQTAIGFDQARGDTITISSRPFINTLNNFGSAWYQAEWLPDLAKQVTQLLALAIVILGIVRPLVSRILVAAPAQNTTLNPALFDAIEVADGESLEDLQVKLDTVLGEENFQDNITYDEKIELLRHMAGTDVGRISTLIQALLASDKEYVQ